MRSLLRLVVAGLLCVSIGACAGTGKDTSSANGGLPGSAPGAPITVSSNASGFSELKGDEDDDDTANNHTRDSKDDPDADSDNDSEANENKSYQDQDDKSVSLYGHPASAAESRTIRTLVEHYYEATVVRDGAGACSLMYVEFATSIPTDYGEGAGPAYSHGDTCAMVMTKLSEHFHSTLVAGAVITSIRINGDLARALIGSKTLPASYLPLKRERGVWKVDALFALPLP